MQRNAKLVLDDGTVLNGKLFGAQKPTTGELVFNTGMVGYPETLTDPSYRGQILALTYPLIGNYGVPLAGVDQFGLPRGFESGKIQAAGLIVSELSETFSSSQPAISLDEWLTKEGVPGLTGIDTRLLTKRLRAHGTMPGRIVLDEADEPQPMPDPAGLVPSVSIDEVERWSGMDNDDTNPAERPTIALMDCGCKANIMRSLLRRGIDIIRVPYDYDVSSLEYDGLLISNGPGDPSVLGNTTRIIQKCLTDDKPILGICLGHQLLALAAGAESYKLKFGHRSQNQPCLEHIGGGNRLLLSSPRCMVTSQNHSYAIRPETIPRDWSIWFTNANDDTVEGIRHTQKPFFGVQFHPEANPGPVDSAWIFDDFAQIVKNMKDDRVGASAYRK